MGKDTQIEKPKKELREPLQKKKAQFEAMGWEIIQVSLTGLWYGFKDDTRLEDFEKIEGLFKAIEGVNKAVEKNSATKTAPEIRTVEVDPSQLLDKSPIVSSFSVDKISDGKIRKPFEFEGKQYVFTGGVSSGKGGYKEVDAYQIAPECDFTDKICSYIEKTHLNIEDRTAYPGFYHGMPVKFNKDKFVMVGPKIVFVPKKEDLEKALPTERNSVDSLGRGLEYEARGWQFDFNPEKQEWSAVKQFGKVSDGVKNVNDLDRLLKMLDRIEKKYETSPVTAEILPTKQEYAEVPLAKIRVSQTTPQKIRRLGFTNENLADITNSVRQNGVLEPILLRRLDKGFEIAAGERRFLAANGAGLKVIPAIIKTLTDTEVDDIQLHENLHREEPHPLEEAATYEYMANDRGFELSEIALRAAKSVKYVSGRMELNRLSDEVKEVFRRNEIMLSHALEIAKYPANDQPQILMYSFSNFGHTSQALYPMKKFIETIESLYLLQLSKAPFSTKADNLRADGLACVNCPDRTGAKPLLFEDRTDKKDACLNRKCYEGKVKTHIQIQRQAIVVETKNVPVEKAPAVVKQVPLLSTSYYVSADTQKNFDEKVIGEENYKKLKSLNDCAKAEYGVFAVGDRNGQKEIICRKSSGCLKHWKDYQTNHLSREDKSEELLAAESLERRNRKEEIIDVNVGEIVRREVLKQVALNFDAENTIFNHPAYAEDYLEQLTNKLWQFQCHWSDDDARIIRQTLGISENRLKTSWPGENGTSLLTDDERARLYWLIIHAPLAKMSEGGHFKSQKPIEQIADDFEVDYQMIDAFERLKYAQDKHEKHAKEFHNYLVKVEAGDHSAEIPRVYSPDYKPKEK